MCSCKPTRRRGYESRYVQIFIRFLNEIFFFPKCWITLFNLHLNNLTNNTLHLPHINIYLWNYPHSDIIPTSVQSSSEEYNSYNVPGVFIITGTIVGTALILLNVLLVGFCLHRRTNKRIRGLMLLDGRSVVFIFFV